MARPRSDIAPRILHAARARFLLEGVDGASLRQIAADAGTSIGMVYYYYPTKDELFLAVVEEIYAALLADLSIALAPDVPVEERLVRVSTRVGAMSEDELTVIRLVIREALVSSDRLGRLVTRFSTGHLPMVLTTLVDGMKAGVIGDRQPLPVMAIAAMVILVGPQVVRRLLGGKLPAGMELTSPEGLGRRLVDVLLYGIAPRR
jgi:AcrR family transcriptional regulator